MIQNQTSISRKVSRQEEIKEIDAEYELDEQAEQQPRESQQKNPQEENKGKLSQGKKKERNREKASSKNQSKSSSYLAKKSERKLQEHQNTSNISQEKRKFFAESLTKEKAIVKEVSQILEKKLLKGNLLPRIGSNRNLAQPKNDFKD